MVRVRTELEGNFKVLVRRGTARQNVGTHGGISIVYIAIFLLVAQTLDVKRAENGMDRRGLREGPGSGKKAVFSLKDLIKKLSHVRVEIWT